MDRDSNDIIGSLILSGIGGIVLFLAGASMLIWNWGPGLMGGLPLMLGGLALPLWKAHSAKADKEYKASRRTEREPTHGYEIETTKYREQRRRR